MCKNNFKEILFDSHLKDLQNISTKFENIFICPICLKKFNKDDIKLEKITDGHVWPKRIRNKGDINIISSHRVLLCKKCNSNAGRAGDFQMQLHDELKDEYKTGQYRVDRNFKILSPSFPKGFCFKGTVDYKQHQMRGQIKINFKMNAPHVYTNFKQISTTAEHCSMLIETPQKYDNDLSNIGWITSAYLFAFYVFGYHFINTIKLEHLRQYILKSFEKNCDLVSFKPDNIFIRDKKSFRTIPVIKIITPIYKTNNNDEPYLQISYLDWEVDLPFGFDFNRLIEVFHDSITMNNIPIPEEVSENECLVLEMSNERYNPDVYSYSDYILGRSI